TSAQHDNTMIAKFGLSKIRSCDQSSDCDRAGALDVVIEGAESIAIALQNTRGVVLRKVLPLQQHVGKLIHDRNHKPLNKVVVIIAADAFMSPAEIKRIIEQLPVVRPHIKQNRQSRCRMNSGAKRVERKFADRDSHSTNTQITEP